MGAMGQKDREVGEGKEEDVESLVARVGGVCGRKSEKFYAQDVRHISWYIPFKLIGPEQNTSRGWRLA